MKRILTTLVGVILVVACFCAPLAVGAINWDYKETSYFRAPTIDYFAQYDPENLSLAPVYTIDGYFPTDVNGTSMIRDYIPLTAFNGNVLDHRVNRYPLTFASKRIGDEIRLFPEGASEHADGVLRADSKFVFTITNFWNDTGIALNYTQPYTDLTPTLTILYPNDAIQHETDGKIDWTIEVTYYSSANMAEGIFIPSTKTYNYSSDRTTRTKINIVPLDLPNGYICSSRLVIDATAVVYGATNLNCYIASTESTSPVSVALNDYANGDWVNAFMDKYQIPNEMIDFEDISWTEWLGNAIGGVFDVPLFGGASLGTILGILVAFSVVIFFLKKFAGG